MWVLCKLLISAAVFFYRFTAKGGQVEGNDVASGKAFEVHKITNKGNVRGTVYRFDYESPAVFKLSPERWYDRIAKFLGLATELQTGDQKFDQHVYIASDSDAFKRRIHGDKELRDPALELFNRGCQNIRATGWVLQFHFKGDESQNSELKTHAVKFLNRLTAVPNSRIKLLDDPFFMKALVVEALIWSVAGYAIAGAVEYFMVSGDYYLDFVPLMWAGLKLGAGLVAALMIFVALFMRGSSRGHRIIAESAIVLALAAPAAGIEAASDVNMDLDTSAPVQFDLVVERKQVIEHRGRRGRKWYSHHLYFPSSEAREGIRAPTHMRVAQSIYSEAREGQPITLTVGHGRLGIPWYKSITFK